MTIEKKCMIPECNRPSAAIREMRGLCMVCYNRAKAKVATGDMTWEVLVELGLCLPNKTTSPFDDAYSRAIDDLELEGTGSD